MPYWPSKRPGWKINQRIEYKIFLLHIIKFLLLLNLATSEIWSLLTHLIIETRSSSSVTLSRPSSSSSLKITDRSFRYASPCLWNKLPASFCQPNPDAGERFTLVGTLSVFRSRLKTYSFDQFFQPHCLYGFYLFPIFRSQRFVFVFSSSLLF